MRTTGCILQIILSHWGFLRVKDAECRGNKIAVSINAILSQG